MPVLHFSARAFALLLGMIAARTAPLFVEDCGCTWQQEYMSMHAATKLGRRAQRYTAVSYHDTGEIQAPRKVHIMQLLGLVCL